MLAPDRHWAGHHADADPWPSSQCRLAIWWVVSASDASRPQRCLHVHDLRDCSAPIITGTLDPNLRSHAFIYLHPPPHTHQKDPDLSRIIEQHTPCSQYYTVVALHSSSCICFDSFKHIFKPYTSARNQGWPSQTNRGDFTKSIHTGVQKHSDRPG